MAYYVIGDDKGFEQAYTAEQVNAMVSSVNTQVNLANNKISALQGQVNTVTATANSKQNKITSGTAAPTGGSNGDIYIQY